MDYQEERFRQHTPYLQWLQEQQDFTRHTGCGKRICRLAFLSCLQTVSDIVVPHSISDDAIYLFVNEDGAVSPAAEEEISAVFCANEKTEFVYADEDYLGTLKELYDINEDEYPESILAKYRMPQTGLYRGRPWLKPDFSPDTFKSFFYIGNIFAVRGSALSKAYHPKINLYELVAGVLEMAWTDGRKNGDVHAAEQIVHLPRVLFTNNCLEKSNMLEGRDCLKDQGDAAESKQTPLVSVIIPSKDNSAMLFRCIDTLAEHTEYTNYELIIVDNGSSAEEQLRIKDFLGRFSGCRYIYKQQPFHFSDMCNTGAQAANGEYLLFLNDDIEVFDGKWLGAMLESAMLPHAGAVGAKLYYPKKDGCYLIQHAGITNMAVGPAHKLCGLEDSGNLYHGHNIVTYNMLALTGACLMVQKKKFECADGFDRDLAVAYNDVELCIKLYEKGFYNILRNDAVLIHHESQSRGKDSSKVDKRRLAQEKEMLYKKHMLFKGRDPFYSPNLVQFKKNTAYHINYLYACDVPADPERMDRKTIKRLPRQHKNKVIRKLLGENIPMFEIDSIGPDDMEQTMLISGWYVLRNQDNAAVDRQLILQNTEDKNKTYRLPVSSCLREDVEAMFGNNTALSGIHVSFDGTRLAEGTYKIGLFAQKKRSYLTWSDREIDISGKE